MAPRNRLILIILHRFLSRSVLYFLFLFLDLQDFISDASSSVILLMVQKSQGQPPGSYKTLGKSWDFNIPNLNWLRLQSTASSTGRLIITSSMSAGYHQGLKDLQLEQGTRHRFGRNRGGWVGLEPHT